MLDGDCRVAGLAADRLELEITEAVLLQSSAETIAVLHQLRQLGVRIALDDFGTGYSSLSYLRSFPFDKIKIDRSFIRDIARCDHSVAIIRAVAGLGRDLGMSTTAEGVETAEQLAMVRAEGLTRSRDISSVPPARPASFPNCSRRRSDPASRHSWQWTLRAKAIEFRFCKQSRRRWPCLAQNKFAAIRPGRGTVSTLLRLTISATV